MPQPLPRPTLLPGLRPLWRNRHTVQLGTDPKRAVVLELPHPAAAKLLELLDGSHTERALLAELARVGLPEPDARNLLTALAEAGLVVPAHTLLPPALTATQRDRLIGEAAALAGSPRSGTPAQVLRRRGNCQIIVAGRGRLATLIAHILLDSGIGRVGQASAPGESAIAGPAGEQRKPETVRATDADFVVQVGNTTRAAVRGTRRRVPHLAVCVRDAVAVVGPMVPSVGGPCLNCLDLHRTDRDPAWPALAAQLIEHAGVAVCAAATRHSAAGFAAGEVLAYLDGGEPSTVATTVEITGTAPWRRRTWTPHPSCDCTRRRR